MGQGVGDSIDFLGVFEHGLEVHGGVSHKNDGDIQNVDILLVCLDVAIADSLEADALFYCLLADTNLLTMALGGHSDHVAFRIDMVLAELDILERTVYFLILTLKCADAQKHDSCKRGVLLNGLEVGTVEKHLIFVHKLGACGGADVVCRTQAESAQLIGGFLLEHELCRTEVVPSLAGIIVPHGGFAL